MSDSSIQQPISTFAEGLQTADAAVVEQLYAEYRKPVARAVETAGGSNADGNTFFRVALLQCAMLVEKNALQPDLPAFDFLKYLAVEHFRDWAAEKQLQLPESRLETPELIAQALPDAAERLELRQFVRAKRQWLRLDEQCRKILGEYVRDSHLNLDTDPLFSRDESEACLGKYLQTLGASAEEWPRPLPAWIVAALTDITFNRIWNAAETQESKLAMGQSAKAEPASKITRNVLIVLGMLFLSYVIWLFFTAPKSAKAIYEENYKPPASIMADRAARAERDSIDVNLPEPCEQLLQEADVFYQQQNWDETASVLAAMLGDESEICKSDAFFYLGVVSLQMGEPEITVECLSKITDLERFGDDLYWYQALAFVKIAANNPLRRELAQRAVERARSNTELPERREQAEKMLRELED